MLKGHQFSPTAARAGRGGRPEGCGGPAGGCASGARARGRPAAGGPGPRASAEPEEEERLAGQGLGARGVCARGRRRRQGAGAPSWGAGAPRGLRLPARSPQTRTPPALPGPTAPARPEKEGGAAAPLRCSTRAAGISGPARGAAPRSGGREDSSAPGRRAARGSAAWRGLCSPGPGD